MDKYFSAKKFDLNSYEDNDRAYRAISSKFKELTIKQRGEDFGIDCDIYLSEESLNKGEPPIATAELEVKHNWKKQTSFPFTTVNFLAKKEKHIQGSIFPFWILFNEDCSDALVMRMDKILSYPIIDLFCRGVGMDKIRQVPISVGKVGIDVIERYIIEELSNK